MLTTTGTSCGYAELAGVALVTTEAGGAGHEARTLLVDPVLTYVG